MRGLPTRMFVPGIPKPQGSKSGFASVKRMGRCSCRKNPKCKSCYGTGTMLKVRVVMTESLKRTKPWRRVVLDAALKLFRRKLYRAEHPLHVVYVFAFQRPPSHVGANGGLLAAGRKFPGPISHNHGDVDKLVRAVNDAVAGTLFDDDAQVVSCVGLKCWTTGTPGLYLSVSPFVTGEREQTHTLLQSYGMALNESLTLYRFSEKAHSVLPLSKTQVAIGDWSDWTGENQLHLPESEPDDVPFGRPL